MFKPARNATGIAIAAVLAAACGGSGYNGPAVGSIKDVTINQDTTAMVPLPVTDNQAPVSSLSISASAADGSLVLAQGLRIRNDNGMPMLYVTPAEDAVGQTLINLSVKDTKGGSAKRSFMLTVNAVNIQFSVFSQGVLAKTENDTPSPVSGFTFVQDADDSTAFDALLQ